MNGTPHSASVCVCSVQSPSRVQLFATPWTAARQASLSITNSWGSLKLRSIESAMPSSHLILCRLPGAGILHIEWGSGIAQLEFYHCRGPAWGTLPVAKVMRKEARHTQRRDRASGVPLEILKHLPPKPVSAYFLLCAFTYTSDFMGAVPHYSLWKKELAYSFN